jgi:osomolarity two-component system response regulator SSK1
MVDFKLSGIKRRFLNQRSSISSIISAPTSPTELPLGQEASVGNEGEAAPDHRPQVTRQDSLASPSSPISSNKPELSEPVSPITPSMPSQPRKLWVKRSGAAPTLVLLNPDHLVDEAKELILRRYQNSLGRQFDAPDVTLRLVARGSHTEQTLSPDEVLWEILDKTFPGGQKMDEALIIHVPTRRTPRHSPLLHAPQQLPTYYYSDDNRPHENGTDYFPPMANLPIPSPSQNLNTHYNASEQPRAMSIITTGQMPPLISPGGTRRPHNHGSLNRANRPQFARHNTTSPSVGSAPVANSRPNRPRVDSVASEKHPPVVTTPPSIINTQATPASTITPRLSPRLSSPKPGGNLRSRRPKKLTQHSTTNELGGLRSLPPSFIDTPVPPINILIVEDNNINMKLLEQFVRRLKVHWATAVNGKEAVEKWRQGGFHLVLMDIQLPIMSGLEATREIRRLERVNHIGVMSGSAHSSVPPDLPENADEVPKEKEIKEEDLLKEKERFFKSSVIIVALTASNLQSDRHEALAAGCNDFLTKVSFSPSST